MRYILPILLFFSSYTAYCQAQPAVDSSSVAHVGLETYTTIEQINIYGNKQTRRNIILREMSIEEGQVVPVDSLGALIEKNRLRLATVGLFTDINIVIDTVAQDRIIWNVHLKERWYYIPELAFQLADRNFNVWWTEQNRDIRRTIIGLTLSNKNFRGRLENLSVTGQIGYTQKFYIDYSKPYIDKKQRHGLGISFGFAESQETFYTTDSNKLKFVKKQDEYIMRQYEGAIAYTYRPGYAARHMLRLSYKYFKADDTVLMLKPNYYEDGSNALKMFEFTYRYELNKTDNWNYPLKGTKLIAQLFVRVGLQGMKQQVFGTLEAGQFSNPWPKWYTSVIFRGRLTTPERQPYVLQSALGTKYDYVRGYEYYVIDGAQFGVLRANFKRELLNITIKRIPIGILPVIPLRIYPKIFADVGYVNNRFAGNSFLNNRALYSAGVGVDVFTAYDVKIRAEYAWNHLGQKGLFLHFNSE